MFATNVNKLHLFMRATAAVLSQKLKGSEEKHRFMQAHYSFTGFPGVIFWHAVYILQTHCWRRVNQTRFQRGHANILY